MTNLLYMAESGPRGPCNEKKRRSNQKICDLSYIQLGKNIKLKFKYNRLSSQLLATRFLQRVVTMGIFTFPVNLLVKAITYLPRAFLSMSRSE